ncbi:MAG: hypothetical protein ACI9ON_002570 [Limisphaerales bacterium]|jgi:hypothetical protein
MKLTRQDLWTLEDYSERRDSFRSEVIEHKKHRRVFLGPHATLYFEDNTTMRYQVQEMLRVEKIFTSAEIEEELAAYNPLIPDGSNWKATFMIEYSDSEERRLALTRMAGIEHRVWVQIGDSEQIMAVANEDLERSNEEKTSAVHFLRFELPESTKQAVLAGAVIQMGIDHSELPCKVILDSETRASLVQDLSAN